MAGGRRNGNAVGIENIYSRYAAAVDIADAEVIVSAIFPGDEKLTVVSRNCWSLTCDRHSRRPESDWSPPPRRGLSGDWSGCLSRNPQHPERCLKRSRARRKYQSVFARKTVYHPKRQNSSSYWR